jgi:hypothetical protein
MHFVEELCLQGRMSPSGGRDEAQQSVRTISARSSGGITMRNRSSFSLLIFIVTLGIGVAIAYAANGISNIFAGTWIIGIAFVLAYAFSSSIQVADQWSRAVVLRLGKYRSLEGPGLFLIIPMIENIPYWIDTRVLTSSFKAEKTLTKDTVPVDVDAVLFWKIVDPKKAALDVADYQSAINWASQTALRDVIGKTMLSDMLEGRDKISDALRRIIDERTEPWGINVISVDASPGRSGTPGPRDTGRLRASGGAELRRSGQDLCERSGRLAS